MNAPTDNPIELFKRKAIELMLRTSFLGGIFVTILHSQQSTVHLMSFILPPTTSAVSAGLLLYLQRFPRKLYWVIYIFLGWGAFVVIFPEYFFIFEALSDPSKRLVDILPPISSGLFLLPICIVVFLNPPDFIWISSLLWLISAAPIVIYLLFHQSELATQRGVDLMVMLLPAMGINIALIALYNRLQNKIRQLDNERCYLKEASERDGLTGVYNRRAGESILEDLMRSAKGIGLILCDVDHFKQVNDGYGHLVGDEVLQTVAQCLQSHLRKQDMLMRWGGEEFLVAVVGDDVQELIQLAERLRITIASQSIPTIGSVTASFGVALKQQFEQLDQLFARADQALYQAKHAGRNQVILA